MLGVVGHKHADDLRPEDFGETSTIEVRAFRDGALIHTELCESEEEATAVVDAWEEQPGVECEVDDLSAPRPTETSFEVDRTGADNDYPPGTDGGRGPE